MYWDRKSRPEFGIGSVRFIQWFLTKLIRKKLGTWNLDRNGQDSGLLRVRFSQGPVYSGSGLVRVRFSQVSLYTKCWFIYIFNYLFKYIWVAVGEGIGVPINWFNTATCLCLFQVRARISFVICRGPLSQTPVILYDTRDIYQCDIVCILISTVWIVF